MTFDEWLETINPDEGRRWQPEEAAEQAWNAARQQDTELIRELVYCFHELGDITDELRNKALERLKDAED